jgi:hypothetical protein
MVGGPRVVLKGAEKLQILLSEGSEKTKQIISNELKKATFETENLARERVPVITGRLQGSIKAKYNPRILRGVVGSSVNYAGTVEYGPNGEYGPEQNIPGSRTGFKPYLRPSLARAMKSFNKNILLALQNSGL